MLAFRMDFSFLLRQDRNLLSIGYRVDERQLDESCYDLLASEARLTSLFAIAKGDVPTNHWFRLGRPIVEIGFSGALMSWAGSMFEYLMPPLVMKEPQGGILNQTSHLIIKRQIQLRPLEGHPVGHLGSRLQRPRPRDDLPVHEFRRARARPETRPGAKHRDCALCDHARRAVQAARGRPEPGATCARSTRSDTTASTNPSTSRRAACRRAPTMPSSPTTWPTIRACRSLPSPTSSSKAACATASTATRSSRRLNCCCRKKRRATSRSRPFAPTDGDRGIAETTSDSPDNRLILDPLNALLATNVMSNGRYSVMVTATGTGYSRLGDISITRWQSDPTEDRMGSFLFVRDAETGEWWSGTPDPKSAPDETARTIFSDEKASFVKTAGKLRTEVECIVVTEGNGEGRRITIWNDGDSDRHIEVTSYAELVLAPEAADSAHPAFSKMFVQTQIGPDGGVIFARRRPRSPGEAVVELAHFVDDSSGSPRATEAETDRRLFIGRGRTIADPAALQPGARLSGSAGLVLDPVLSLRRQVRVPARKKVSVTFWTIVGATRQEVEETMARLQHPDGFARQMMLSWTRSQVQTRHCGLSLGDAANVQRLARYLLYPSPFMRLPAQALAAGLGPQSSLWPTSISGDFPIFALQNRRRRGSRDRRLDAAHAGISAGPRHADRPGHRQRAGRRPMCRTCSRRSSGFARTAACAATSTVPASISSRCAAT